MILNEKQKQFIIENYLADFSNEKDIEHLSSFNTWELVENTEESESDRLEYPYLFLVNGFENDAFTEKFVEEIKAIQ